MKKHHHRFETLGSRPGIVVESCACGEKRERTMTSAERRREQRIQAETDRMHRVYKEFRTEFRAEPGGRWNWTGYELMERIEEWAKKHPRDVLVMGIDDGTFSSSTLAFILHRDGGRLWGTSVVGVTQNDGQPPFEYFMYPGHAHVILLALRAMESFRPWDKSYGQHETEWEKTLDRKLRPFGIKLER